MIKRFTFLVGFFVVVNLGFLEASSNTSPLATQVMRGSHRKCPDLVVDKITINPTAPNTEDTITFRVRFKNQGNTTSKACSANTRVGHETRPPSFTIPQMAPGATFTRERRLRLPLALAYQITATADTDGKNTECDEGNNVSSKRFRVTQACPDLVVDKITIDPTAPNTEDTITFRVRFKNQGKAPSKACSANTRVGHETRPPSFTIPRMAPGATFIRERRLRLRLALPYQITATADIDGKNTECDEDNNVRSKTFRVTRYTSPLATQVMRGSHRKCPDLVVDKITINPTAPNTEDTITFRVRFKNQGNTTSKACSANTRVGHETRPPSFTIPRMAPGATFTRERRLRLRLALAYQITATADTDGKNTECDEGNNVSSKRFRVTQACPDLVVDKITISPTAPNTEDTITFRVRFKNQGKAPSKACSANTRVGHETRPPSFTIPRMAPGATFIRERRLRLRLALPYQITATADIDGKNTECDEDNNVRSKTFRVTRYTSPLATQVMRGSHRKCPDLVVDKITINPTAPNTEDTITFRVRFKNQGNTTSKACSANTRVGHETRPPSFTIPRMAPGATFTRERRLRLPLALPYQITATADTDGKNTECDEGNNVRSKRFRVT